MFQPYHALRQACQKKQPKGNGPGCSLLLRISRPGFERRRGSGYVDCPTDWREQVPTGNSVKPNERERDRPHPGRGAGRDDGLT